MRCGAPRRRARSLVACGGRAGGRAGPVRRRRGAPARRGPAPAAARRHARASTSASARSRRRSAPATAARSSTLPRRSRRCAASSRACAARSRCSPNQIEIAEQAPEGPVRRHRHAPAQARAGAASRQPPRRHAEAARAPRAAEPRPPRRRPTRRRSTSSSSATTRSPISAIQGFLVTYPKSTLAPRTPSTGSATRIPAQRDYKQAIAAQQQAARHLAREPKAPDALLSIASSQETMGDREAAQKTLEELIAKYPRRQRRRERQAATRRSRAALKLASATPGLIKFAPLLQRQYGSLAQLVEQRTFNPLVGGSNPPRPTKFPAALLQCAAKKSQTSRVASGCSAAKCGYAASPPLQAWPRPAMVSTRAASRLPT